MLRDRIYRLGAVIAFLGLAGTAEAVTGTGSVGAGVVITLIGFSMCLVGYSDFRGKNE